MAGVSSVRWREWGQDAFTEARAEGKLVFLDISATWCHWCHVLDRTSLSDPEVVRTLNEEFIPVRVDTDRRPDINERYNQGGWPTTAVLLPDGRLLTGATYLPPDDLRGMLEKCAEFYRRDRERIDGYRMDDAAPTAPGQGRAEGEGHAGEGPRPEDLSLVRHFVLAAYDPVHPGFFREPKFLVPEILAFLRDSWARDGDAEAREFLLKVLRAMGKSAVFDPVEGGFFRYATRRDWSAPHYEKLLADNACMLSIFSFAYERTGEERIGIVARKIAGFLFARLRDPATGAFFSSQDADEEYYLLDAEGRRGRPAPYIDRTVISEYNGRALSGLVSAHRAFGGRGETPAGEGMTLLPLAEELAEYLRADLWDPEEGQVRFRGEGGPEGGFLADNASLAEAYLDLFEAAGKGKYLDWAGEILDWSVRRFFSPAVSGFLDRRPRPGDAGALHLPVVPFALNARMACALMRYSRIAGRTDGLAAADLTLKRLSEEFGDRAAFAAPYGSALLLREAGSRGGACLPGDPSCAAGGQADASNGSRAG